MTIVVDASAVLSVLKGESDQERFKAVLFATPDLHMSVVNAWEVMARYVPPRGAEARRDVELFFSEIGLTLHPVTSFAYALALEAQLKFGWATPAKLNMGDCFAYALAQALDAPILYKGEDFALTDVRSAL